MDVWYVLAWIGGVGRRIYVIERDEKRCQEIAATIGVFEQWLASDEPPQTTASLPVLRAKQRMKGRRLDLVEPLMVAVALDKSNFDYRLDAEMNAMEAYEWLGKLSKTLQLARDQVHAAILQVAGDATYITSPDGWSCKIGEPYNRESVKAKDLKLRAPELYRELVRVTEVPGRMTVKAPESNDAE
jgi:hypothetical protein